MSKRPFSNGRDRYGRPLPPVADRPEDLCVECGVVKGLHRDIAQSGTHNWTRRAP